MSDDLRQKAIDLLVADIVARVKADDPKATLEIRALVAEKLGTHTLKLHNEAQWLPAGQTPRSPFVTPMFPNSPIRDRSVTADPAPGLGPEIRCVGTNTIRQESHT